MATIYIDNQAYSVKDGQNLLQAALSLGFDLPYFCWHPAMHSVGACRQCAVKQFKDAQDTRGRIVMACMTPAVDGARISLDDPEARAARRSVIEFLMVNHPHDCPVCDEGGECHLQDMTVMAGHTGRRYRFEKRTHRNQELGPFVNHEMNRCIACYRCVRYYRDLAGGRDLDVFSWRHHVYFGRARDGLLESEFSGNLVEICPTGVFTDKTLGRHYTRKWDLATAPSVCVHCGAGCNTIPGERYGLLRRIRNRFHDEVNGYFLCDRGRYGYEFVNLPRRIRQASVRTATGPVARETAMAQWGAMRPRNAIGIGSPRASLEANYALRALVGPDRFHTGLSEADNRLAALALELLRGGRVRSAAQADVRAADALLILGEDISNTAPLLALDVRLSSQKAKIVAAAKMKIPAWDDAAVREAAQAVRTPLFIATPCATRLDGEARIARQAAPEDIAALGFAVARAVAGEKVEGPAAEIADALAKAERPVVLSGTLCASAPVLRAAAAVAEALIDRGRAAALGLVLPECNSLGLALIGGRSLEAAAQAVRDGRVETVVVVENDLFRRADADTVEAILAARHLLVIDHLPHATAERAEMLLPAATFAESTGTCVNSEGRAQRFFQVMAPAGDVMESWRWLRELRVAAGQLEAGAWRTHDAVLAALAQELPALAGAVDAAPPATARFVHSEVPRQPHRYSGRTAMTAHVSVHEPPPPPDPDSPLRFSMEGYPNPPPPALIPRFWAPGWNSIQALNKFQQEVGGPLRGAASGKRLIEPAASAPQRAPAEAPGAFRPRAGEWLLVPVAHVFGSEELSAQAPGVASLAPAPYIGLNAEEARGLGLKAGDRVAPVGLPLRIVPSLPPGVAAWPQGLPGMPVRTLPAWLALARAGGTP